MPADSVTDLVRCGAIVQPSFGPTQASRPAGAHGVPDCARMRSCRRILTMWCRRPHEMTWVGNTQAAVGRLMTDGAYADDRPRPAMTGRGPKGTARRSTRGCPVLRLWAKGGGRMIRYSCHPSPTHRCAMNGAPKPTMTGRGPKGTARRNTTSSQRAPADASACPLGARVLDERRPGGASSMRPRLWPLGPCYLSDTSLIALPFHVTVSV